MFVRFGGMLDRCVQMMLPVAASIAYTSSLPVTMYMIPW